MKHPQSDQSLSSAPHPTPRCRVGGRSSRRSPGAAWTPSASLWDRNCSSGGEEDIGRSAAAWASSAAAAAAAAAARHLPLMVVTCGSSLCSNSILDHLGSSSGAPSAVGQEYQLGTRRLRVLRQLGEGGERPLLAGVPLNTRSGIGAAVACWELTPTIAQRRLLLCVPGSRCGGSGQRRRPAALPLCAAPVCTEAGALACTWCLVACGCGCKHARPLYPLHCCMCTQPSSNCRCRCCAAARSS